MKSKRGKPNDKSSRKKRKKIESETRKHITWDPLFSSELLIIDADHPSFHDTTLRHMVEYKLHSHMSTQFKTIPVWTIPFQYDDLSEVIRDAMVHHNLLNCIDDRFPELEVPFRLFRDQLQSEIASVTSREADYVCKNLPSEGSKHIMHIKLEQE